MALKNSRLTTARLGMSLVGPGFIAAHHIDAVRRLGNVDVVAIAGSSLSPAQQKAREWHVERAYGDFLELIGDPNVDVVHNTTPNHLHFAVSMTALLAGKHVVSDILQTPPSPEALRASTTPASGRGEEPSMRPRGKRKP